MLPFDRLQNLSMVKLPVNLGNPRNEVVRNSKEKGNKQLSLKKHFFTVMSQIPCEMEGAASAKASTVIHQMASPVVVIVVEASSS